MKFNIKVESCKDCPCHQTMNVEGRTVDYCCKFKVFGNRINIKRLCNEYWRTHDFTIMKKDIVDINSFKEGLVRDLDDFDDMREFLTPRNLPLRERLLNIFRR